MLTKLGNRLSELRAARGASLEAIATPAKISAAYLHKLEAGNVNNPSPRVLARLAKALEADYLSFMELAGYFDEMQVAEARKRSPRPHPLAGQDLSPDEWRAVGDFIEKLVGSRRAGS